MNVSIDIIIPSFRLEKEYLLPILQLHRPEGAKVKFYLISDNPTLVPDAAIAQFINGEDVILLINEENKGAAFTRNRGINAGNGEWILFLDDDIEVNKDLLLVYHQAIINYPDEIGFIGVVDMPPPPTLFAKAVETFGSMSVFTIAKKKADYAWGATANMMVRRSAVGDIRFSLDYPRSGGGEDVDFFINVRDRNNRRNYKCLPEATVCHPWWNEGKPGFKRFYRYGIGNSYLPQFNPQYAYYDFLSTSETLFLAIPVGIILCIINSAFILPVSIFLVSTLLFEYITSVIRVKRIKKEINLPLSEQVYLLKNMYELGILVGNLRRLRLKGLGERFSFDGKKSPSFVFNRYKIIKLVLNAVLWYLLLFVWF